MALYTIKMWDLLEAIESLLKSELNPPDGIIRSVKRIYKGTAFNPPEFPVIAVTPVREYNDGIYNDGIKVIKRVRVSIWSKSMDAHGAKRMALGIRDTLISNLFLLQARGSTLPGLDLDPQVYTANIAEVGTEGQPQPFGNAFIHQAFIDIDFYTKDQLTRLQAVHAAQGSTGDTKTIVDSIMESFKAYKSTELIKVKRFKDLVLPPAGEFPMVYLNLLNEGRQHRFAGRDSVTREFQLIGITKKMEPEESLKACLDLTDDLKQVLFANCTFGGKVVDYEYRGVSYGQLLTNPEMLYASTVEFTATSFENLNPPD